METLNKLSCLADYYELPLQEIHKAFKIQESFPVQQLIFAIEEMYCKTKNINGFVIDINNFVKTFDPSAYPTDFVNFNFSKQLALAYTTCYPVKDGFPIETSEACCLLDITPFINWNNFHILEEFSCIENKRQRFEIYKKIIKKEKIPYFIDCIISKWEINEKLSNHNYVTHNILGYSVIKHLCSQHNKDNFGFNNNLLLLKKLYSYYKIQALIYTLEHIFNDKKQPKSVNIEVKKNKDIIYISTTSLMDDNSVNKNINNKIDVFNNFGLYHLSSEYEQIPFLKNNNFQHSNQTMTYNYRLHKKNRFDIYHKFLHACKNMNDEDRHIFIQCLIAKHEENILKETILVPTHTRKTKRL